MNNNDECFFITPENLVVVLAKFCQAFKSNPLKVVSMDEILEVWNQEYTLNDDGEYQISESDFKEFMEGINSLQVDRIMLDMDKKGQAQLGWNNGETCLIANKD